MLSTQSTEYANRLEQLCNDVLETVESIDAETWTTNSAAENWPVAVVALHIAEVQGFFSDLFTSVISDPAAAITLSQDQIDAMNHHRAVERADVSRDEVLTKLRANGPAVIKTVADLSDDQLALIAGNFNGDDTSIDLLVQYGLIAHFEEHLASIKAAIA